VDKVTIKTEELGAGPGIFEERVLAAGVRRQPLRDDGDPA
jgi:hypothetical protein